MMIQMMMMMMMMMMFDCMGFDSLKQFGCWVSFSRPGVQGGWISLSLCSPGDPRALFRRTDLSMGKLIPIDPIVNSIKCISVLNVRLQPQAGTTGATKVVRPSGESPHSNPSPMTVKRLPFSISNLTKLIKPRALPSSRNLQKCRIFICR